jgi:hypothetical protein
MDNKAIHANFMSVILSETDCDLAFKTIIPNQDVTGRILDNIISDSINVFMSINQAKSLLELLKKQIEDFEKTHGLVASSQINVVMQQVNTKNIQDKKEMEIKK